MSAGYPARIQFIAIYKTVTQIGLPVQHTTKLAYLTTSGRGEPPCGSESYVLILTNHNYTYLADVHWDLAGSTTANWSRTSKIVEVTGYKLRKDVFERP